MVQTVEDFFIFGKILNDEKNIFVDTFAGFNIFLTIDRKFKSEHKKILRC